VTSESSTNQTLIEFTTRIPHLVSPVFRRDIPSDALCTWQRRNRGTLDETGPPSIPMIVP